jgi:hypothetical protein
MAITKATSSVLADNAALNNLNAGASIAFTKPVSVSGNLTVDTNTLFVDSTNNRVGIGTNNPQQAIDFRPITFNVSQSGGIRFDNTSGTWPCGIYIRSDGSGGPRLSLDAPYQTNTLNLYDNNVGIGTLTPTTKLDVVGSIKASGNLTVDTNTLFVDAANDRVGIGTTTPTFKLQLSGASTLGIDTAGSEPAIVGGASVISLKVSSGAASIFRGIDGWTGTWRDSAPTTYFQVGRASGNTMFSSLLGQSFNRLSFTVSNTTNNGVVFTTETGSLSSPVGYFEIRQGSTPNFLVQKTTGNIGIGTTTPNEKLTISGNLSASGNIIAGNYNPAANVATFLATPTSSNLAAAVSSVTGSGSLVFATSPTLVSPTINTEATFNATSYTYGTDAAAAHRTALGLDTLLNAKANLSGGNTFTGTQTISGSSLTLQNAGTVTLTLNDTAFANIPTFNLQQAGTTRARIEGGVGLTSRMDFSVGLPISRSMSLNQGGTQNYGVTIGRSSVAGNVAPPTDGLHVQGTVAIGTTTPNEKLTVVGNISATGIVTAEGNKLAAETFAIAMAIAVG